MRILLEVTCPPETLADFLTTIRAWDAQRSTTAVLVQALTPPWPTPSVVPIAP
jgi:hypothetical protein